MRSGNVAAISRHHELGAFEEHIAATTDKVDCSIDFAAFPIGAALLGVVGILATQKAYILEDKLIAFILLQSHLARRIGRTDRTPILQGNILHVHIIVFGEIKRCCGTDALYIRRIPNNRLVYRLSDDRDIRRVKNAFAMFITRDLCNVVFAIGNKDDEAVAF